MNLDEFNEILRLDSFEFVDTIYLKILKRKPDPSGKEAALTALSAGADRRSMALAMMYSVEARRYSAQFRDIQEMLEAENALRRRKLPGRGALAKLMSWPIKILKQLRPRSRLLALAQTSLRPFLGILPKRGPILYLGASANVSLDDPLELPASLSSPAADVYRDLIVRFSTRIDQP